MNDPAEIADESDDGEQPGTGILRAALERWTSLRRSREKTLRDDAVAGLSLAAGNIPDGMANAILVGVNPLYGLYATMVGPIGGATLSSTQLMVVSTTAAASLTAGQALGDLDGQERESALFLMTVLIGAILMLFGALRLGRLTRFVSYSVMTGFLMGVGVLIMLSQLPNATGYAATGDNAIARLLDLLGHLNQIDPASTGVALVTLVLAIWLPRTRLGNFGILAALVIASALALLLQLQSVRTAGDIATISGGVPSLQLPALTFDISLFTGALSVAVIVAVQSAGVSQNVPNANGARSNISRDFFAMGIANIGCGLLRGLPVGGSLSSTALSLLAGARSRWAAIFAGLWMALLVVAVPQVVSPIAMPALGALLMLAGARTLKPAEAFSIWSTGWPSRLAIVTTFLAMLFLPIQAAVGIGVVLSALLTLGQASAEVRVVERVEHSDGGIEERVAPDRLPPHAVTVLHIYGHLFYAGARTLEDKLPSPRGARNAVVVMRMRGRSNLGATLIDVLASYAKELQKGNGRLYLAGINPAVRDEIVRTAKLDLSGPVQLYEMTPLVGEATRKAVADAKAWLASQR